MLTGDTKNCGQCGNQCTNIHGTTGCISGLCNPTCQGQALNCDGNLANGCEDVGGDLSNCGGCGKLCATPNATPLCQQGVCKIAECGTVAGTTTLYNDCDSSATNGCESNPLTDVRNCGACGQACSSVGGTPTCSNGVCTIGCATGSGDCNNSAADGCEVNLDSDVRNCAVCGHVCTCPNGTPNCINGSCGCAICDTGYGNCSGNGCVNNLNTEVLNCGTCGHVCTVAHGTASCASGQCSIVQCNTSSTPAYADCNLTYTDGCETPLNTLTNCGDCNVAM